MTLPFRFTSPDRRKRFSRPLAALAIGALTFASLAHVDGAHAAPEGTLGEMSVSIGPQGTSAWVRVESEDGKTWTKIKNESLPLGGPITVDMATGRIKAIGIFLGDCDGHQCIEGVAHPMLGSAHLGKFNDVFNTTVFPPTVDGKSSFVLETAKLGVSAAGIAVPGFGDAIIARCNAALKNGGSIQQEHTFVHVVPMTLGVDTRTVQILNFGSLTDNIVLNSSKPLEDVDFAKTVNVELPVICEAVPVPPSAGAPGQVGTQCCRPFEVVGATLHGDPAEYAGACPVGIKLFMSAKSNIKGPFEARIESKTGWKSEKYSYQTTESNADGTWSKHFQDTLTVPVVMPLNQSSGGGAQTFGQGIGNVQMNPKNEEPQFPGGIPKMGDVQTGFNPGNFHEDSLRLVVTGNGKTIMTDWWKYSVTCDPKKAQVADGAPTGVQQSVFVQQAFLALLPVAPRDGSKCGVTVSGLIQTNVKNVNVTFRLKNHQGNSTNAQTIKTSHANNIGKFVEYLDFSTSGQGVWVTPGGGWALPGGGAGSQAGPKQGTLQIVVENPATFEGNVASYNFTCHDPVPVGLQQVPTVKVDPNIPRIPGNVVGKGNDQTAQPDKQIVAPQIVCLGGTVKGGKCLCDGETVVIGGITSGGRTTYRCAAKPREDRKANEAGTAAESRLRRRQRAQQCVRLSGGLCAAEDRRDVVSLPARRGAAAAAREAETDRPDARDDAAGCLCGRRRALQQVCVSGRHKFAERRLQDGCNERSPAQRRHTAARALISMKLRRGLRAAPSYLRQRLGTPHVSRGWRKRSGVVCKMSQP
jgi:hypothetical protein